MIIILLRKEKQTTLQVEFIYRNLKVRIFVYTCAWENYIRQSKKKKCFYISYFLLLYRKYVAVKRSTVQFYTIIFLCYDKCETCIFFVQFRVLQKCVYIQRERTECIHGMWTTLRRYCSSTKRHGNKGTKINYMYICCYIN